MNFIKFQESGVEVILPLSDVQRVVRIPSVEKSPLRLQVYFKGEKEMVTYVTVEYDKKGNPMKVNKSYKDYPFQTITGDTPENTERINQIWDYFNNATL